jgi:hypothetical protein
MRSYKGKCYMLKKNGILWITFMVLAVFLLSACSKKKSTKPEPADTWTILGYFDGNNDQDKEPVDGDTLSCVLRDVVEMEQVGSTQDVRIIVMLGSFKTEGNCYYYHIEKQLDKSSGSIRSPELDSLGKKDMSNPQTLRDFIQYGVEHYPSDHYVLIINDGGSGWKGICSDQLNGDGDEMILPELSSQALFGYKFDIILFNVPSMSMVEVVYQLKEETDYIVASQYCGLKRNMLASSIWLQGLVNDPNMNALGLARSIAIAIHTTAVSKGEEVNISVINPSKVGVLASKIADFGSVLLTQTGEHGKELADARETEITLSYFTRYYFDLKKFCQNIQSSANLDLVVKSAAQIVEDANDAAVVTLLSSQEELGYGGLCIHFPFSPEDFDSSEYVELAFAVSGWHGFLSEFIKTYANANTGSLRVVSEPVKGARIFLDGQDTGLETDTTIHGIPIGEHKVKLTKSGYKDTVKYVYIRSGSTTVVTFGLIPNSSESIFEFTSKATVF